MTKSFCLLIVLLCVLRGEYAVAQTQRIVAIPAPAKRATITFSGGPDVLVDGRAARLGPGARIFDRNNYLQVHGAISGTFRVRYLLESTTGLVQSVWILTDEEIAAPDPAQPQ
jgi:hypothetical protein